jgi:hypothetical protein
MELCRDIYFEILKFIIPAAITSFSKKLIEIGDSSSGQSLTSITSKTGEYKNISLEIKDKIKSIIKGVIKDEILPLYHLCSAARIALKNYYSFSKDNNFIVVLIRNYVKTRNKENIECFFDSRLFCNIFHLPDLYDYIFLMMFSYTSFNYNTILNFNETQLVFSIFYQTVEKYNVEIIFKGEMILLFPDIKISFESDDLVTDLNKNNILYWSNINSIASFINVKKYDVEIQKFIKNFINEYVHKHIHFWKYSRNYLVKKTTEIMFQ